MELCISVRNEDMKIVGNENGSIQFEVPATVKFEVPFSITVLQDLPTLATSSTKA